MEQPAMIEGLKRKIKAVTPLANYKLLLEFDDEEKRIYDVEPLLVHEAFASLLDEAFFQQVHVVFGYTIGWNEEIDICPDCLYDHSTPYPAQ